MISDWVKLARLSNAIVAGIGVWLGHTWLSEPINWTSAVLGSLALAFLAIAGNIQNDVLDLEADRINRPKRPLPSGRLASKRAYQVAIVVYFTGIALGFSISLPAGFLALGIAFLLHLYNSNLKTLPLWGNLTIALLCALAVYFPEFPGMPIHTGIPVLFAFLTTLAREIAKDAEDMLGDTAVGWQTFPIRYGIAPTRRVLKVLVALILVLLPIPYFSPNYHMGYGLLVMLGPMPLLLLMFKLLSQPFPDWKEIQRRFKWIMLAGVTALFVGIFV